LHINTGLWLRRGAPNGTRISRRRAERSEAKPVGWMRLLCGLRMGQSQRTLPRTPATRTLPRKTAHPQTQRRAR